MRRLLWFVRVLVAAVAGGVVRAARRLGRRPPRIWHGFTPLHATPWMVEAERRAGLPSISVVLHTRATWYALVRPEDFDRVFEFDADRWDDAHWLALLHLLGNADIWNAYFDSLFFHAAERAKNEWVFRLIKFAGIRIVVQPHGGDLLCSGVYPSRYGWAERAQLDYPGWDLGAQREVVETRVALFTRYADFMLAGDPLYEQILPRADLTFHAVPVDTHALAPARREVRAVPVIVHAPNHRNIKGTAILLAALERLRAGGLQFELRLIEGVPRQQALDMYKDADIVADQFLMGAFGVFALEGLALGKTVLTYLDAEHLRRPLFSHPIVNTTPENLVAVLAVLHALPDLRARIGAASRESVLRYQSFDALAAVWSQIYLHVWRGESLQLDRTPPFDPARRARALTEDPSSADFWPVPVDDLMQRIRETVGQASNLKAS